MMHIPSVYWSNWVKTFDYIFYMRNEVTSNLRHHTDVLTGTHPHQYFNYKDEFKDQVINKYESLKLKLKDHTFSEPEICGGFGFWHNGALINKDIIRYMWVFFELQNNKMLKDYDSILEIGSGFGGLATQYILNYPKSRYFMVDLPEVLYFAASYIKLNFPEKTMYIYKKNDINIDFDSYDFILLPPWAIESVKDKSIDLILNQSSLGEMTPSQVDYYLSNINRIMTDKGIFFSHNKRFSNGWNLELDNLTDKLVNKFSVVNHENLKVTKKYTLKHKIKLFILSNRFFIKAKSIRRVFTNMDNSDSSGVRLILRKKF